MIVLSCLAPLGISHGHSPSAPALVTDASPIEGSASAVSLVPYGPPPTEATAGTATGIAWQAVDASGAPVSSFAAAAEVTVTESASGSAAPVWVNASRTGPLAPSANGSFAVPPAAWNGGVLEVTVDLAVAVPVRVGLTVPSLPATSVAVPLTVLPDLDHLALYNVTELENHLSTTNRSYTAFWHVRDRFGNPAPGAALFLEYSTGGEVNETVVPVTWSGTDLSGAWVNATVPGSGAGAVTVLDAAGTTLLALTVPAAAGPAPAASGASLSPFALVAVALLAVGGVGGVGVLLVGGRPRLASSPSGEEGELRRLAEGRASVVEIVRAGGALSLREIENAWEPPPAPPAIADWVASLVTDGTLTAALDPDGSAKFALADRSAGEPRVTLDAEALAQGIARRDAAIETDDAEDAPR